MVWFFLALTCSVFEALKDLWSKMLVHKVDEYFVAWALYTSLALCLLPVILFTGVPPIQDGFLRIVVIASALNVLAASFYMKALRHSEMSLCMPFLTFTPVFMLGTGPLIVREVPHFLGVLGVLCIVAGAYVINLGKKGRSLFAPFVALARIPGPRFMLAVAFIWSFSAPFDKLGMLHSGPFLWLLILSTVMSISIFPFVLKRMGKTLLPTVVEHRKLIFAMGVSQTIALCSQMLALGLALVTFVIAIKRLSVVWGVFLGHFAFREENVRGRLLGAVIMVLGVALIAMG